MAEGKSEKKNISAIEARKVRWVLIYTIYQTLLSVTRVPEEVHDPKNVPYCLSVTTTGCPPWKREMKPFHQGRDGCSPDHHPPLLRVPPCSLGAASIQPDIDYRRTFSPDETGSKSIGRTLSRYSLAGKVIARSRSGRGSVQTFKMQKKPSYREILVDGYGNGNGYFKESSLSPDRAEESDRGKRPLFRYECTCRDTAGLGPRPSTAVSCVGKSW